MVSTLWGISPAEAFRSLEKCGGGTNLNYSLGVWSKKNQKNGTSKFIPKTNCSDAAWSQTKEIDTIFYQDFKKLKHSETCALKSTMLRWALVDIRHIRWVIWYGLTRSNRRNTSVKACNNEPTYSELPRHWGLNICYKEKVSHRGSPQERPSHVHEAFTGQEDHVKGLWMMRKAQASPQRGPCGSWSQDLRVIVLQVGFLANKDFESLIRLRQCAFRAEVLLN